MLKNDSSRVWLRPIAAAALVALFACSSGSPSAISSGGGSWGGSTFSSGGSGGSSAVGGSAGSGGSGGSGGASCAFGPDPLNTNDAGADAYDCMLVELAQQYTHPDPMMVKAQVRQESAFDVLATSSDNPCGIKLDWTDAESKSFGLVQITPACGGADSALLPDGHPNLTKDMTSPMWGTSVYNPVLNLSEGYNTITTMLAQLKTQYAGCTDAQYVLMSAGAFDSGLRGVLGCAAFNVRAQAYVDSVLSHYHAFARSAGWPDPY